MACLAGVLAACSAPANKKQEVKPAFFELGTYMEGQIAALQSAQPKAFKVITFNGKSEEKQLDKLDYERELALFVQADINKPAWIGKYSIDSTFKQAELESLQYKAIDEALPTRHIRIDFAQNQVSRVVVREKLKSVLADTDRELIYLPKEGYQINSTQTGQAGDNLVALHVKWLK